MPWTLLQRKKRFRLFVALDAIDGPPDRWFHSLDTALRAFQRMDPELKPGAWIIEYRDGHGLSVGGIDLVRNVVHLEHGERTDA